MRGPLEAPPRPAPTVTVRTLALGLVLLVAFIVMAPTLRAYVTQREQYRRLEADIAATQSDVDSLDAALRRWSDAGYVQAQARERLSYVMPGEVAYRVIDPETVLADGAAEAGLRSLTTSVDTAPAVPWYLTFWDSVLDAAEAPQEQVGSATIAPPDAPPGEHAPREQAPREQAGSEPAADQPTADQPTAGSPTGEDGR